MAKPATKKDKLKSDLKCEIEEIYSFLNPEHTLVYARVSWNDRKPKDEIRKCVVDEDGDIHLSKGLSITKDEAEMLAKVILGKTDPDKGDEPSVSFEDIFRASEGIMEKREAGYQTEDGFIVVKRRGGK